MDYKISVSLRAQAEIEETLEYYAIRNENASLKFYSDISNTYHLLSINPFYSVYSKNIRFIPLKKIPFSLFFEIDIENKPVNIRSCFHQSQSPTKHPKF